jgi:hypothetical protein
MEFLVPSPETGSKAALAVLISKSKATYLYLYSWEDNSPLRNVNLDACSPHRLHDTERMPLLMIPSSRNASFILVTESGLAVYDEVLSPNMRQIYFKTSRDFPPTFTRSRRSPLWVQWAKPFRHANYIDTNDDFFLVHEDGNLEYFELKHSNPTKLHTQVSVGKLPLGVDTAFAILEGDPDQGGGDICVVGGDMTDGGVYHIRARENIEQIQTLTNLAPIRDMLLVDTNQANVSKRTLVCAGKGDGHASIAEIRHGLEARIGLVTEQQDARQTTGLWVLPTMDKDRVILIVSTPMQTLARRIDFGESTIEPAEDDAEVQGADLDSHTLAFAVTKDEISIQITTSAIIVWTPRLAFQPVRRLHGHCTVSVASINCDLLLCAIVAMMDGEFRVLLGSIDHNATAIGVGDFEAADLKTDEPSSVLIVTIGSKQILLIGTVTGWLHIFHIVRGQSARPLMQCSVSDVFPQIEKSAVCSLALLTDSLIRPATLVCGTRNGWLLNLTVCEESTPVAQGEVDIFGIAQVGVQPGNAQRIGQTSVELIPDSGTPSAALLYCGFQVHRVLVSPSEQTISLQVSRLWFTDSAQVSLRSSSRRLTDRRL